MFRRKPPEPAMDRWLVLGLGNPGPEYAGSRHNIGFLCMDALAQRHGARATNREARSLTARIRLGERELILAKPQTMMNLSGLAARALRAKYHVELDRVFVVHDDIDLPFGRLRIRKDGSSAGHHGVDSLIEGFGSRAFARFRVGVDRPVGNGIDYVLGEFTEGERAQLPAITQRVADAVVFCVEHGLDRAMTEYNQG
jgi:PTH1 family peptidyl-tRNA hydrolase